MITGVVLLIASQSFLSTGSDCDETDSRSFAVSEVDDCEYSSGFDPFLSGQFLSANNRRKAVDRMCSIWSRATNGGRYCDAPTTTTKSFAPNNISQFGMVRFPKASGSALSFPGTDECDISAHCRLITQWPDDPQIRWNTSTPSSNFTSQDFATGIPGNPANTRDGMEGIDLTTLLLHEVGHSVGLKHPQSGDFCDNTSCTTNADCPTSNNGFTHQCALGGVCIQTTPTGPYNGFDCSAVSGVNKRTTTAPSQIDLRNIAKKYVVRVFHGTATSSGFVGIPSSTPCDTGLFSYTAPRTTCTTHDTNGTECIVSYRPSQNNGPAFAKIDVDQGGCSVVGPIRQSTWMSDGPVDLAASFRVAYTWPQSTTIRKVVGIGKRTVRAGFSRRAQLISYTTSSTLQAPTVQHLEQIYANGAYPTVGGSCPENTTSNGTNCIYDATSAMTHSEPRISYASRANRFLVVYTDLDGEAQAISLDENGFPSTTSGMAENLPKKLGFTSLAPIQPICDDHETDSTSFSRCYVWGWSYANNTPSKAGRLIKKTVELSGSGITVINNNLYDWITPALLVDGFKYNANGNDPHDGSYVLNVDPDSQQSKEKYGIIMSGNATFSSYDPIAFPFLLGGNTEPSGNTTSFDINEATGKVIIVGTKFQ